MLVRRHNHPGAMENLDYFVEWRPGLWAPAVRHLIADPQRFNGKVLLDLGCANGRMSCLFGLLGARVTGVEIPQVSLSKARAEAERWGLTGKVEFTTYDGDPGKLPGQEYDFVFTKSVLIKISPLEQFLANLSHKMKAGGELLMAENLPAGMLLHHIHSDILRLVKARPRKGIRGLPNGVDQDFLCNISRSFEITSFRKYYGLVAAVRAHKSSSEPGKFG